MTYAPLNDRFDDHPRYAELGAAEMGIIACAITYANRNLSDGRLPRVWPARRFGREGTRLASKLTRLGIWMVLPDGDFSIVGFLDHNPSRDEILAKIAKRSNAGRKGGISTSLKLVPRNGQASAAANAQANGQASAAAIAAASATAFAQPLHYTDTTELKEICARDARSSPVQVPVTSHVKPSKRPAERPPPSTTPEPEIREWLLARGLFPDDPRTATFLDVQRNASTPKRDWPAAWRQFLRFEKSGRFDAPSGAHRVARPVQPEEPGGRSWKVGGHDS